MNALALLAKLDSAETARGRPGAYAETDLRKLVGDASAVPGVIESLRERGCLAEVTEGVWRRRANNADRNGKERLPGPRDVALAYARNRGWRVAPSRAEAENAFGISTQVPVVPVLAASGVENGFRLAWRGGACVFEAAPDWVFALESEAAALAGQAAVRGEGAPLKATAREAAQRVAPERRPEIARSVRESLSSMPTPQREACSAFVIELERLPIKQ